MKNKNNKWFLRHGLIIIPCTLIVGVIIVFIAIIGQDIATRDIDSNVNITDNLITEIEKSAIIIVAASDSTILDKEQADFVADGIDDQVTIQAAIDALPAGGGKVLLLEGKYHVGGPSPIINLRPNFTLAGVGSNTIIRLKDGMVAVSKTKFPILKSEGTSAVPMSNIRIKNFAIDGNITNQIVNAWPLPIQLNHSSRFRIEGMYIFDTYTAIETNYSSQGIISNNFIRDVIIGDGIGPNRSSYLIITGNVLENAREGIDLDADTNNSIVSNNILRATTRAIMGIMVTDSSYNMIVNNRIEGHPTLTCPVGSFDIGVWLRLRTEADTTMHNIVKGNNIRNMTKGMRIDGTDHIIQGNFISDIKIMGIQISAVFGTGQRVIVSHNQFYNIGEHGISIATGIKDIIVQENQFNNIGIAAPNIFNEVHVGF